MATIGKVYDDAQPCDKQDSSKTQDCPKKLYFGVFFDGTNNNMVSKKTSRLFRKQGQTKIKEYAKTNRYDNTLWETIVVDENNTENVNVFKNGANLIPKTESGTLVEGYSNVAILHSFYQGMSKEEYGNCQADADLWVYNIYVEGVGTDYDQAWYSNVGSMATGKGSSGVSNLVCKAVAMVRERLKMIKKDDRQITEVHFDVFGFSRGATCARLFSYLALRSSSMKLECEDEFKDSLAKKYYYKSEKYLHFLDKMNFKSVTVDFLGLFDTVSSIGGLSIDTYAKNVRGYGLESPTMDKVLNTFHLCAMDEFRAHFALTDIGSACQKTNNAEIFIPGCHTDVGGGYETAKYSFELIEDEYLSIPEDTIEHSITLLPINVKTLEKLGWYSDKEEIDTSIFFSRMTITRKIEAGYSNIPLTMMKCRVEKSIGDRKIFRNVEEHYPIDNTKFNDWSADLLKLAQNGKGRKWYYPGNSFTSDSYKKLRHYLHFSSSESFVDKTLGNTPNYYNQIMCRPIYHGDGNFERDYMATAYQDNIELRKAKSIKGGSGNEELNRPLLPYTLYIVGDCRYLTDADGNVRYCSAQLKSLVEDSSTYRNQYQQGIAVSKKNKNVDTDKNQYDGGHIFAAMFEGPGEQINYFPQLRTQNRKQKKQEEDNWYDLEQHFKKAIKDGKIVKAAILFCYSDPTNPHMPTSYRVKYQIGDEVNEKLFSNLP